MSLSPFRHLARVGTLLALVGAVSHPAAAQLNPYSLEDLLTLVRGGVTPARLADLAGRNCLAFPLDDGAQRQLRQAGAGAEVISALSAVCIVTPGPRLSLGGSDLSIDPSLIRQVRLSYGIRALLVMTYESTVDVRATSVDGRRALTLTMSNVGADAEERSETVVDAQTLAALRYHLRRVRRNGNGLEMELRREGDRIVGWAAGGNGVRIEIDEPVFQNSILPGAEDLILQGATLAVGQSFSMSTFNTSTARACTVTLRVEGERSITVPAGTFDTYQIRVGGCDYGQRLYVRKETPHLVIKQDFTTVKVDLRAIIY